MINAPRRAFAAVPRTLILLLALTACGQDRADVATQRSALAGCAQDRDCDDGVRCTADICNLVDHTCLNLQISGCCTQDSDCDDGTACTKDACSVSQGRCLHTPVAGCCTGNGQCNDQNSCTDDNCIVESGVCQNLPHPHTACCQQSGDCVDGDICTVDICLAQHSCSNVRLPGCCTADAQCDDGVTCTRDVCDLASHTCAHPTISELLPQRHPVRRCLGVHDRYVRPDFAHLPAQPGRGVLLERRRLQRRKPVHARQLSQRRQVQLCRRHRLLPDGRGLR